MFTIKYIFLTLLFCLLLSPIHSQVFIHSHNDYKQLVPFYQAYSQGAYSIEVDLFLYDDKLLVGHTLDELNPHNTFESMYIEPLQKVFTRNNNQPYPDSAQPLQLMIELKSETHSTLSAVVAILNQYPTLFNPAVNKHAVIVTITGRTPAAEDFSKYPTYLNYDGAWDYPYSDEQLKQVALISAPFRQFSTWNGKGSILPQEEEKLRQVIDEAHRLNKPIRFWGAPEGISVYYTFFNMGIDYINTDKLEQCAAFYSDFDNRNFTMGKKESKHTGITKTDRLDKTTRSFSGFQNDKLQLSKEIVYYQPTYATDGLQGKIKNVIFLIGDGMGLSQITAAAYANQWLSLLNMKHIGFQFTNALNTFTTDSAAAGSALATGQSHNNRHISMDNSGREISSLSNYFHDQGMAVGVLTLGNLADATPAAFYGHSTERDNSDEITSYLNNNHIDLLCGSGMNVFTKRNDKKDIIKELTQHYQFVNSIHDINTTTKPVIAIDESMGVACEESNINLLAEATLQSINKLQTRSDDGFFLMVEGAKIDYAGHARCLPGVVLEMLSFDLAVAEALKFADTNNETLVIVTGDHETGGLTLLDGNREKGSVMGHFLTDDHTPAILPVFAYGVGSHTFIGTYNNTEIANRIMNLIK